MLAAYFGHTETIKALIEAGAELDITLSNEVQALKFMLFSVIYKS